jgi:hypothetical protein
MCWHPCTCCFSSYDSLLTLLPSRVLQCVQGDYVEVLIITKDGIRREELQLKLD